MYNPLPPQYYHPVPQHLSPHTQHTQPLYRSTGIESMRQPVYITQPYYTVQNDYTNDDTTFDSDYEPSQPSTPTADTAAPAGKKAAKKGDKQVSNFISKIYKMVSDPATDHIVAWNERGDAFVVKNEFEFATVIMKQYFRHQNFSSFVRQLNFYGFHKRSHSASAAYTTFSHMDFKRDNSSTLYRIQRKSTDTTSSKSSIKDSMSALQLQVSELNSIVNENRYRIDKLVNIVTRYMSNGSAMILESLHTPSNGTAVAQSTKRSSGKAKPKPAKRSEVKQEHMPVEPHSAGYKEYSDAHRGELPLQQRGGRQRSNTWQSTHDTSSTSSSTGVYNTDPLLNTLPNLPGLDYQNADSGDNMHQQNTGGHSVLNMHPGTPSNKRKAAVEPLSIMSPTVQYETDEHSQAVQHDGDWYEHKELEAMVSSTTPTQRRKPNNHITIVQVRSPMQPHTPNVHGEHRGYNMHEHTYLQPVSSPLFSD